MVLGHTITEVIFTQGFGGYMQPNGIHSESGNTPARIEAQLRPLLLLFWNNNYEGWQTMIYRGSPGCRSMGPPSEMIILYCVCCSCMGRRLSYASKVFLLSPSAERFTLLDRENPTN